MKRTRLPFLFFLLLFSATVAEARSLSQAAALLKESRFAEAATALKECEIAESGNSQWYLISAALFEKQRQFEQAVDILKQGYYRLGNQKEILYNLGNNLFALGKWNESIEFYNLAVEADSTFSQAYFNRGNAFLKVGKLDEAIADYETVLRLNPAHPQKIAIERMSSLLIEEQRLKAERARLEEESRREQARRLAEMREEAAGELADSDRSRNLQVDNSDLEGYLFDLDIME